MGYGVTSDNSGNIFVTGNTAGAFGGQTHIGGEDLCLTKFKSIPEPMGIWIIGLLVPLIKGGTR